MKLRQQESNQARDGDANRDPEDRDISWVHFRKTLVRWQGDKNGRVDEDHDKRDRADADEILCHLFAIDFSHHIGDQECQRYHKDPDRNGDAENSDDFRPDQVHADKKPDKQAEQDLEFEV